MCMRMHVHMPCARTWACHVRPVELGAAAALGDVHVYAYACAMCMSLGMCITSPGAREGHSREMWMCMHVHVHVHERGHVHVHVHRQPWRLRGTRHGEVRTLEASST